MGKKVHKGFFSYLFIFLGIAVAFVLVCAVIMICSPGTKIFGLSYYKIKGSVNFETATVYSADGEVVKNADGSNKTIDVNTVSADASNFKTIEINSNLFDVEFAQKSTADGAGVRELLSINIDANAHGFTNGTITKLKFVPKYFEDTKTLQINIEVPTGFINFSSSNKIKVNLPMNFSDELNIVVNSQNGNVKLGGSEDATYTPGTLNASSANITTTSGNISTTKFFKSTNILKDYSFKTETGDINYDRALVCKNLDVTTKTGEVKFSNEILTVAEKFNFTADHSYITINKITSPIVNFAAKSGKIYANEITGNVELLENTNNCDLQVDTIDGFLKIGTLNEENISTKTTVKIKNYVSGICNICTTGDINIGEIRGTTKLRTHSGSISVPKVNAELTITAVSSNINLGNITDDNGEIVDKGITKKVVVNGSENTNINAYFKNIIDGSTLITKKGNIQANISQGATCKIVANAKGISVDGIAKTSPLNYHVNSGTDILTLTSTEGNIAITVD